MIKLNFAGCRNQNFKTKMQAFKGIRRQNLVSIQ
jgi:hypothetical protein